jgi:hypothetical protein
MNTIIFRWSGLLMIAGAVLLGIGIVMIAMNPGVGQPISPQASLLLLLSGISLLLALPAMYARQTDKAGWLGLIGHIFLQTGTLMLTFTASTLRLNWVFFLLGIAFTLGLLLTGIATIRAGVYPRWAGILLLAATAGFIFDFFIAEFLPPFAGQAGNAFLGGVLALALAWIGLSVWAGITQPRQAPIHP